MFNPATASDGKLKDLPFHRRLAESLDSLRDALWRNPTMLFGLGVLAIMAVGAFGAPLFGLPDPMRSEEHTSELQSRGHLVCRLLLEKKKYRTKEDMLRTK